MSYISSKIGINSFKSFAYFEVLSVLRIILTNDGSSIGAGLISFSELKSFDGIGETDAGVLSVASLLEP